MSINLRVDCQFKYGPSSVVASSVVPLCLCHVNYYRCCRRFLASTAETDKSQKDGASPSTDGETTSPDGSTEAAAFDVERKKLLADLAVVQVPAALFSL